MTTGAPVREILTGGTVALRGECCSFFYRRPRPGVVDMRIVGAKIDDGELGSLPMDELRDDLRTGPIDLFIDMSQAVGAMVPIQESWALWFARHRSSLRCVHMLVQGSYMQFTAEVVKFFSRTDNLIRVYLDPAVFAAARDARPARNG